MAVSDMRTRVYPRKPAPVYANSDTQTPPDFWYLEVLLDGVPTVDQLFIEVNVLEHWAVRVARDDEGRMVNDGVNFKHERVEGKYTLRYLAEQSE